MQIGAPEFYPKLRIVTKPLIHWNYFLSLENDYVVLSKYLEFCPGNFNAYSIETGRLLMTATQECDVLFKQICTNGAEKENGYRQEIPSAFPDFPSHRVIIPRFNLSFQPFQSWANASAQTPIWWTANNKFKHKRHESYELASLENSLNAISALLLCNIYFYHKEGRLKEIQPIPQLLIAEDILCTLEPTKVGMAPNFRMKLLTKG
jgi:hypothetical protein